MNSLEYLVLVWFGKDLNGNGSYRCQKSDWNPHSREHGLWQVQEDHGVGPKDWRFIGSWFQRTFNSFYRVRRNAEWQSVYYDLFEEVKDSRPTFEYIIRALFKATGNIEASFYSKMLATINTDMPIWDRYVVQNLCLELKGKTKEAQLDCAIELYDRMTDWYRNFLITGKMLFVVTPIVPFVGILFIFF